MTQPWADLDERRTRNFWKKVRIVDVSECWFWTGAMNKAGYGHFRGGFWGNASRIAYYLATGVEPKGDVMHSCENKLCCNPAHLSDGHRSRNMGDHLRNHPREKMQLTREEWRAYWRAGYARRKKEAV